NSKVRKFIALTKHYISNREFNAFFIPKIAVASFINPWSPSTRPATGLTHVSSTVRLKSVQSNSWFSISNRDHDMDMIRSHTERVQIPLSNLACFSNGCFNALTLGGTQNDDFSFEPFRICL